MDRANCLGQLILHTLGLFNHWTGSVSIGTTLFWFDWPYCAVCRLCVICNIVTVSFYASLHRSSPHIPSINITIIAKKSNPSISSIELCKGIIGALEQASKLFWVAKLNAHHRLIISLIIYCKSYVIACVASLIRYCKSYKSSLI